MPNPNVEIHGLKHDEAEILKRKIFGVFFSDPRINAGVTIHSTKVENVTGDRPFLRLFTTPMHPGDRIKLIRQLSELDLDIEYVELTDFYPNIKNKSSSKPEPRIPDPNPVTIYGHPKCELCGAEMVNSGTGFKCLSCGNTVGCG